MSDNFVYADKASGAIYLSGEVNVNMYHHLIAGLAKAKESDNPSLNIFLNTPGGEVYHGLAIYDLLIAQDRHITITCIGHVMSMGAIILQAADTRFCTPNSHILIHYGEENGVGSSTEAHHNRELLKVLKTIISDRVSVKPETVSKWFTKESYFDARRAVSVGLVDGVV